MKIFVQIASYRDPQLEPTIKNMLENAKKPKNIHFGIARQFSEDDGFDKLEKIKDLKSWIFHTKNPKVFVGQEI
jgi:hypothetical protein